MMAMAMRTANKQEVYISKSTILHVNHAFLYMKLPNLQACLMAYVNDNTKFSFSFSKHTCMVDTVLSDSTPENFANFWQIKWNWIREMKFETVQFHFWSVLSVCCHLEILPPGQRDVTTSPLYLMALLPCSQECVIQDTPILFWRKGLRIQWLVFKTFKPGFH